MSKKDDLLKMCVEPNTITVICKIMDYDAEENTKYEFFCFKVTPDADIKFTEIVNTIKRSRRYLFPVPCLDTTISISNSEFNTYEEKKQYSERVRNTANIVIVRESGKGNINKILGVHTIKNTNKLTESPNNLAKTGKDTFYSPGQLVEYWGVLERIYEEDDLMGKALIFKEYLANFLSLMYSLTENDIEWLQDNKHDILEDFVVYNHAVSYQGRISEFLCNNLKEFKNAPWKQINTRILGRQIGAGDSKAIQTIQSIFK